MLFMEKRHNEHDSLNMTTPKQALLLNDTLPQAKKGEIPETIALFCKYIAGSNGGILHCVKQLAV